MTYKLSNHFSFRNGFLFCEEVRIRDLVRDVSKCGFRPATPLFVYSKSQLLDNIQAYRDAVSSLSVPTVISYSLKANSNVSLLKVIRERGCAATLVSGTELEFGEVAGFPPRRMLFNGNGKTRDDVEKAVNAGCLLNVDSDFDCRRIDAVCQQLDKRADVLLRINPDVDPKVHPYVSTGLTGSKFGIFLSDVDRIVTLLLKSKHLRLVGLHLHVGSTVQDVNVYRLCLKTLLELKTYLKEKGFKHLNLLNIGGGLMINYQKHADRTHPARLDSDKYLRSLESEINSQSESDRRRLESLLHDYREEKIPRSQLLIGMRSSSDSNCTQTSLTEAPTPASLADAISPLLKNENEVTLIVEPGRSLVGNTAILVTSVLGIKQSGQKRFIVTDGGMTELIRPSLYGSYHHIELTEPVPDNNEYNVFDVVGPVCESADFLGKNRLLPTPHEGCGLAVFDVGAYGYSMASNYNLRPRPCEVLVEGNTWQLIREPDLLSDLLKPYNSVHCGKTHTLCEN